MGEAYLMVTLVGYRRRITAEALVDSGAQISQIVRPVARRLGVRQLGTQELDVAGGRTELVPYVAFRGAIIDGRSTVGQTGPIVAVVDERTEDAENIIGLNILEPLRVVIEPHLRRASLANPKLVCPGCQEVITGAPLVIGTYRCKACGAEFAVSQSRQTQAQVKAR